MGRRKSSTGIPGLSFSWKRAVGITSAKQKWARATGIPTTKSGRQRKAARMMGGSGCLMQAVALVAVITAALWLAAGALL